MQVVVTWNKLHPVILLIEMFIEAEKKSALKILDFNDSLTEKLGQI